MNLRLAAATAGFVLTVATPSFAGPRDDALGVVAKCAGLADDRARLACYDAAAPQVKSAMGAPAAAEGPPQVAEAPKERESWFGLPDIFSSNGTAHQTTPETFGSENLPAPPPAPGQPPPPEPLDSISAAVTDYAIHYDGRFTIFLDNGQVWQQIPGDSDKAHFTHGQPNKVTISRGALGSYNLQLNDLARIYKVKRIK